MKKFILLIAVFASLTLSSRSLAGICGQCTQEPEKANSGNTKTSKAIKDPTRTYPPGESPIRQKAIEERSMRWVNIARKTYGPKSGRLAYALQSFWHFHGLKSEKTRLLIDEWLEVYPYISSEDQRFNAPHALYCARELLTHPRRHFDGIKSLEEQNNDLLSEKIVRCVLTAMNANGVDWTPKAALTEELGFVEKNSIYSEETKEQARIALTQKIRPDVQRVQDLLKDLKNLDIKAPTPSALSGARVEIEEIAKLFPKLRSMDRSEMTGEILDTLALLLNSDLNEYAKKLIWEIYDQIDISWIDYNSVTGGLLSCSPYYWQKEKDFATVAKLFKKACELEDYDASGIHSTPERHMILGEAYNELGRKKDAQLEYERAMKINDEIWSSGLMDGLGDENSNIYKKQLTERLKKLSKEKSGSR